jgi:hypothetical protein
MSGYIGNSWEIQDSKSAGSPVGQNEHQFTLAPTQPREPIEDKNRIISMVLVKTGEKWYWYSGRRTEEYGTEVMSVGPGHAVEDKQQR